MSAAEDDTELRDLLIQNLENNGVLNKLKAEMRAAVFLAMEEQDRVENKTPLVNENLKKCLNTKDGRLVASLILDFLQVFHLDFTLAVFQPEMNSLNGLDGRDLVCKELGLSDLEVNRNSPVLLELVKRGRHKDKLPASSEGEAGGSISKEPTQKQITLARKKFDFYDKDRSGSVTKEDLQSVFRDLFPNMNKNMLERFVSDELRAADKSFSRTCDFHMFMSLYKRLFTQCRSVVLTDSTDIVQPHSVLIEDRTTSPLVSKIPRYKGSNLRGLSQTTAQDSEPIISPGKGDAALRSGLRRDRVDLEVEDDLEDGDSFFDDPMPKPQKTYGRVVPLMEDRLCGPVVSPMRRGKSLSDLSLLAADSEGEQDLLSDHRKAEVSGARDSPVGSLMEAAAPTRGGGGGGGSSVSDSTHSRNGASHSREKGFRDSKAPNDKTGSLHLDDDVEYDDDFNSHRSDLSKSELSIGEEIEEVSIEGPDASDKFDETTQDLSVSQLSQSHGADYMEDVP